MGLGNPLKVKAVKDILKIETREILLLQEPKIEEESLLYLSRLKWKKNVGKAVIARGSLGGLATLSLEDNFQL